MDEDDRAEFLGARPERLVRRIGELAAAGRGRDLDASQAEFGDGVGQLVDRQPGVVQRHDPEADQAAGAVGDLSGDALVDGARDRRRQRLVAQSW